MPNSIYNSDNSLSRFNPIKNWTKLLFKGDKKLQTTELIEIQDLINNQASKAFTSLYNFYSVIQGCRLLLVKISSLNYEFILTEGQIYININNEAFFIDTPTHSFTINRLNTYYIGVTLETSINSNNEDFKNPQTGGASFGSEGANRLLINPQIQVTETSTINSYPNISSYPIAIIKPKSLDFINNYVDISDGAPNIIYYKNEELNYLTQEINISSYIKKLIELRIHESTGNFISYGMNITINTTTSKLCITPGIAYINGKRIKTNYNNYYTIDPYNINYNTLKLNTQYLFFLNEKGQFNFKEQNNVNNFLETPPNCLALAYVIFYNRNNLLLEYSIIEAPTRMPTVSEILNLNKSNEANIKELAELALKTDLLNLSSNTLNNKLNGIFIDSFVDLNNSDIFYPNYKASILSSIQAISLPFTSTNKNNRNIIIDQSDSNILIENTINENNELVPYWSTINGASYKYFNTPINITNSITIPTNINNSIIIECSPSILYKSDKDTFVNFSHPNLKKIFSKSSISIDTPFNNNIYNRTITVFAKGFPSLQNNIQITLNNITITSFNILKGSTGSTTGTLKADINGALSFTFAIPNISDSEKYVINLFNGNINGSFEIDIIDPEISRINKENTNVFIKNRTNKYSLINSGILQTFSTATPIMIKGIEITIMDFPNINNGDVLNAQIVSIDSNHNPVETLGIGSLEFSQVANLDTNLPIPKPSTLMLNKPLNLDRGKYGIVFNTNISGIKLGSTKAGLSKIEDGQTFFFDPFKTEVKVYDNTWIKTSIADNIACDLILHKPAGLLSSTIINIENNQDSTFNIIDIDLAINQINNSFIDLFILNDENLYEEVFNGSYFFKNPIKATKLKINIRGTSNTHPIINLDNLNINLISNQKEAVWVSKNQEYESPYKSLTMSVDLYKPENTIYRFYFSSNKGVTWEELNNPVIENIDQTLNINKYTFSKQDLGFVILNSEPQERYNLRYKIEFNVSNIEGILPFFKNLISITSP